MHQDDPLAELDGRPQLELVSPTNCGRESKEKAQKPVVLPVLLWTPALTCT